MEGWRKLKKGERVRMVGTGWEGVVVKVNAPKRPGASKGLFWIKVRWDKNGVESRVTPPNIERV